MCIKIQLVGHAVKLCRRSNSRKSRTKSLFYSQAVNVCKWYQQQDWKPRFLEPSGQQERLRHLARLSLEQGLGCEQLRVLLHELQTPRDEKK